MKLYIINGEGYTWDYIHNSLGYTEYPSDTMLYMSAESATWGEYVTSGYSQYEGVYGDLGSCTFFATGKAGWFDLDELAKDAGLFPSVVDEGPEFTNGGATSPSVMYDFNGDLFYLLRDAVVLGWKTESDLAAQGWTIEVDANYELLFFDTSTGKVSYGVESLNEMVFTETGYFTIENDADVVFVQPSQYPVVSIDTYAPEDFPETIVDGGVVNTVYQYYSSKLYIVIAVVNDTTYGVIAESVGWDMSTTPGDISITNNTGASKAIFQLQIYSMDATDAEVVEIKNQSDEHFYAFKWTSNGTPYWYVVAWTHFWTDDLAAAGYDEVPAVVLPTVSVTGDFGSYNWLYSQPGQTTYANVSAGDFSDVYYSGATVTYDSAKCYAIQKWFTTEATSGYEGINGVFSVINDNGSIALKNESSAEKSIFSARCAVCSSNQATVVPVYDSSNNAYNAFKFTASGTDYYYVLDGVQTDWTDDLSSIGYSLTPTTVKGWFNDDKTPKTLTSGTTGIVKDSSGNNVVYDNTKTYHIYRTVNSSGNDLTNVTLQIDSGYYLGYKNETGQILYSAVYVEYYTT